MPTVTVEEAVLLVSGIARPIQKSLTSNYLIIPNDIIRMCAAFYHVLCSIYSTNK